MVNPEENSNWLFDYGVIENIPVPGGDLPSLEPCFDWGSDALAGPTGLSVGAAIMFRSGLLSRWEQDRSAVLIGRANLSSRLGVQPSGKIPATKEFADFEDSFGNLDGTKECGSRKRMRSESCSASDSKACREKMRRDRLNERFQELSSILEPGRKPKLDKAVILSDAIQTLTQLRDEAQKLKESYKGLEEKISELKAEKNELRDEKQQLKVEKEKLEQQVKAMTTQPAFFPYPSGIPPPFGPPGQVVGSKIVPFMGYPGVPMWQFMPPTAVDTSEDHVLRPPVA